MPDDSVGFGAVDLTNCDREPIHIPGSIQPHGALLALEPGDLRVVQAAGATGSLLGAAPEDMLGARFSERVGPRLTAAIHGPPHLDPPARRLLSFELGDSWGGIHCDGVVHAANELLLLELEPRLSQDHEVADTFGLVQRLVDKVRATATVKEFCQVMVDCVREVSGFDRAMMYRFLHDGAGAVDAEALAPDVESYLGLRYPASDIPAQARTLYLRNTLRLIPDARYLPAPIVAAPGWGADRPLDLSHSVLRSVSPIHLQYLANMGVVGSMSVSIVIGRTLWGLIACHHRTARFLPQRIRMALDLFGQMASYQLETRLAAEDFAGRTKGGAAHVALVKDLAGAPDVLEALAGSTRRLLEYLPASGLALWIDGQYTSVGVTPPEPHTLDLIAWLNANRAEGLFHTSSLTRDYPPAKAFADIGSGVLALSVSRSPRDYLIWFRPEQVHTVHWAGDPKKPMSSVDGGVSLSPRTSFAAWVEKVRETSQPWSAEDISMAASLRLSLLEVVLEHVDQLARERQRARVQQDALLAQLDYRIAQWERTAAELKVESDRRAILEAELSQVLRRTVTEQEAERQRIARELHDSLGQYLTAMQLHLDSIARESGVNPAIKDRVERLRTLTVDAGQEVHHLAWEIRPTTLDDLGLQTTLQQLVEDWGERSGLTFDLHLTLGGRRLPPAIESVLYRVVQEAILNIVKHAGARRVGVILEGTDAEVRVIVEDDGKGFVWFEQGTAVAASSRLGLLGMRERLALVNGALEIETAPGQGTTLLIHVPL